MSRWVVTQVPKRLPSIKSPVLMEGLPGIGNVGKVAVDFIVEELKAEKLYDLFSYSLPHSVFVNENNLVELPGISIYHKKGKLDMLFLAGDVQPIDEVSCYDFCDTVLDILSQFNGREVITLGGIGLPHIPKKPKLYCTGNSREIVRRYCSGTNVNSSLFGIVGPIIGVSGILLGLAQRRNIEAVSLLAETYARPMYLGIRGAREMVRVLDKKLSMGIDLAALDKEVRDIEAEIGERKGRISSAALRTLQGKMGNDMSYIG
ncbi:PAC2 family protein [Candidatus Woesearchaeota archaeon]|nr:PAC2 family protein [Candidatus Woesearchaeota archaeon]